MGCAAPLVFVRTPYKLWEKRAFEEGVFEGGFPLSSKQARKHLTC